MRTFVLALVLCFASPPVFAAAAEYSVRFGELRGPDYKVLTPTRTIKLCEKSTGYRYAFEIIPQHGGPYEYRMVMYLPKPPGQVSFTNPEISKGGQQIKTEPTKADGRALYHLWWDKGDPAGGYKVEVVVQNSIVETIPFSVVPAKTCP